MSNSSLVFFNKIKKEGAFTVFDFGVSCPAVHLQRCSAFNFRERRDSVQRCSETVLLHSGARVQLNAHKRSRDTVPQGDEGKEGACTNRGPNNLEQEAEEDD